ncbi:hydrolase [Mesorhizobium sp. M7A.F.Ca.US.011.01.1.1]|uniref:hydrolase n=1 Tax=Mesorhizobium sp. M7A.F.Ca.US.011.01.1.1 TaxID=2496741 RepID=UPI0019CF9D3E|nr:hydrolase [Mesorhizobium sp. M7A.F.Ca.US.011.01.1.1]
MTRPVPGEETTTLSGDFLTKVFQGPYSQARDWHEEMQRIALARHREPRDVYFFYTTCPKCAKVYGRNYVIGVVAVA